MPLGSVDLFFSFGPGLQTGTLKVDTETYTPGNSWEGTQIILPITAGLDMQAGPGVLRITGGYAIPLNSTFAEKDFFTLGMGTSLGYLSASVGYLYKF